jgi:hypothetical protein
VSQKKERVVSEKRNNIVRKNRGNVSEKKEKYVRKGTIVLKRTRKCVKKVKMVSEKGIFGNIIRGQSQIR